MMELVVIAVLALGLMASCALLALKMQEVWRLKRKISSFHDTIDEISYMQQTRLKEYKKPHIRMVVYIKGSLEALAVLKALLKIR